MLKEMPTTGREWSVLKQEMIDRGNDDAKWREGKTAVYVFNAGEDVARVQKEAYTLYMSENGLGPLAFPSLKQMEEEVIGMGLHLLHGPDDSSGTITSGGTDSINMAVKAARDYARSINTVSGTPNIVMPFSAHPAFDKACIMMGLEKRRIPVGSDLLADVSAMSDACDENTIMLVGSAPSFPYGLIDPIEELGKLATDKGLWLHVDACVGGYIAPFVRMNGANIPPFDFEVEAVKSMSADLHKYGYCAKGASTVLFRSEQLKNHMIFDCDDWPGGRMVTPTLAGTRPGGAISAAWAVMNYLGIDGYKAKQKMVTDARIVIERGVESLGFRILGNPQLGIIAYSHAEVDVYAVYSQMYLRGWFTSLTTEPKALHLMLSPFHIEVTDTYLNDLKDSVEAVRSGNTDSITEARYS
ncbi:MAG: aspartate aminotransferase family protein [Gammaproteobacteria bacterium]|jgi:sphinganine-1-phosphate aldolase|nr:aspartate aminotransferase family protein [Gammaproteobacteria bacterium]MBT4493583.1 aspartate aminotransferase family protein [Gammaproteobacteria bacterium]MBT7371112.1 aspartate aminotransferase family protein [Gammaproteobacteria bacterium]